METPTELKGTIQRMRRHVLLLLQRSLDGVDELKEVAEGLGGGTRVHLVYEQLEKERKERIGESRGAEQFVEQEEGERVVQVLEDVKNEGVCMARHGKLQ